MKEHIQPKQPDRMAAGDKVAPETMPLPGKQAIDHPQNILQLQRMIGNRRTVQHLQRLQERQPLLQRDVLEAETDYESKLQLELYKATATPLHNLNDLLVLVKRVEAAYPSEDWQGIATRIRKSYYDGFLWDSMIKDRDSYPGLTWPPLAIEDYKAFVEAKDKPELEINGQSVDIGHVFTGLDAMNFQKTGLIMSTAGVSGPAGATWAGDVGSALAMWSKEANGDRGQRERFYDKKLATNDDMLGDVDGVASSFMPPGGEAEMGGNRLSDRLRWYYQGSDTTKSGVSKRYTNFCKISGFQWEGQAGSIVLSAPSVLRIQEQIKNFAVAFGISKWRMSTEYDPDDLFWFTNRFVQWIEAGLAAENS